MSEKTLQTQTPPANKGVSWEQKKSNKARPGKYDNDNMAGCGLITRATSVQVSRATLNCPGTHGQSLISSIYVQTCQDDNYELLASLLK